MSPLLEAELLLRPCSRVRMWSGIERQSLTLRPSCVVKVKHRSSHHGDRYDKPRQSGMISDDDLMITWIQEHKMPYQEACSVRQIFRFDTWHEERDLPGRRRFFTIHVSYWTR